MIYWISFYIIKFFSKIFFPFTVRGRENIPVTGGLIFASNHLSNLDPFLIGLNAGQRISYMAKASLFRNRVLGFFLKKVGTFPLRRKGPDIGALRQALKRLKEGSPVVVFPEGTRKRGATTSAPTESTDVYLAGVGFLAAKSRVPVIPVCITGSDKVLAPGTRWFKRHPITLAFGPPVVFSKGDPYAHIAGQIMKRIDSLA